jgi:hypothetical protein
MANRLYTQFYMSLERVKVVLFGQAAIGAAGVATISPVNSKGIASITRGGSAGLYTIVLQDQYVRFLGIQFTPIFATTPGVLGFYVVSETVAGAAKNIVVQFLDAAGSAADPASGTVLKWEINLSNSTAL